MKKKIFKLFLVAIVITAIVLVILALTKNSSSTAAYYKDVVALNQEIKDDDKNVVELVNKAGIDMLELINTNNLDMKDEKSFLTTFTSELEIYSVINNEIQNYGNFSTKSSSVQHVKKMEQNFKLLKKDYQNSYDYLKETYFKLGSNYEHIGTVQAYIKNFVLVFKDALVHLNGFYYNAGVAYAVGTKNISTLNGMYRLNVLYYSELANQYFTNIFDDKVVEDYITKVGMVWGLINDKSDEQFYKYIDNKVEFDTIFDNFKLLNTAELVNKHVEGGLVEYINSLTDSKTKQVSTSFAKYILGAEEV